MTRLERTVDIFLDAINNGTLAKGTCVACAVGNLVAHGLNAKIKQYPNKTFGCSKNNHFWRYLFITDNNIQKRNKDIFYEKMLKGLTEYSIEELALIEYTFETNTFISYISYQDYTKEEVKQDQINGLSAVIELIKTFDENKSFDIQKEFVDKVIYEKSLV